MNEIFALPFMQQALAALLMLAVVSAVVGVAINLRNLEFISDGLVHAVFPGVVIGSALADAQGVYLGAVIAALLAAIALTWVARRGLGTDATTAVVLAGTFGVGVVLVSKTTTYSTGLEQLLFGQLLTVGPADLTAVALFGGLALAIVGLTWKEQLFTSFDRRAARAAGVPTGIYELLLNIAIALVIVAAARAVGNLLVLAVLIVPAAVGRLVSRRIGTVLAIALATSILSSVSGLILAHQLSIGWGIAASPSAVLVLVLVAVYLLVVLLTRVARRSAAPGTSGAGLKA